MSINPLKKELSEKEIKMFTDLGWNYVFETIIPAPILYEKAALKCFQENRQGPEVEALRRGYNALQACKIYRMTPDFESLLEYCHWN